MQLTCTIDGRKIGSIDDLYDRLAKQLQFPPHFGRNLDALWDTLTTDLPCQTTIVWSHAGESREILGDSYVEVKILLEEAAGECDHLTVRFEGD